jgi:hypothetical protein
LFSVAKAVYERKDHLYKDATLNVFLLDKDLLLKRASVDTKPKSVRITNLPQEIDRDTLEVVFEDADTFGENISVEDVKLDPKTCSAIIKFAEANGDFLLSKSSSSSSSSPLPPPTTTIITTSSSSSTS